MSDKQAYSDLTGQALRSTLGRGGGGILGRVAPIALLIAGAAGVGKVLGHVRAETQWDEILQDLKGYQSLTPEEESRARGLYDVMRRYAPDMTKDKMVARSWILQTLPAGDEAMATLLPSLIKTQKDMREVKSRLESPLGLAASAAAITSRILGD